MISILDHIEYLMMKNDCVIVPGLGAFIAQYSIAKDIETGIVSGVRRDISFNSSVDYNDGLLINSVMRREGLSFDMAKNEISDYVMALRGQLKHEGEVPVGRLGYFSSSGNNILEFFPFVSRKSNNEYFGLQPIIMKPLSASVAEAKENAEVQEKKNLFVYTKRFMRVAASIVMLIGLALVLSTPMVETDNQNFANINAFTLRVVESDAINDGELYISIPKQEQSVENTEDANLVKEEGEYCLVVASLVSEKQVKKFVKENNLLNYNVFKVKSKYRVYVARGTFEEMSDLKKNEYSESDAWVCRI